MKATAKVYPIIGPWAGQLAIVPRPRGGDWLEDEVEAWQEAGFNVIVSLLTAEEDREFELKREGELVEEHGLRFVQLPIVDRGIPPSRDKAMGLVEELDRVLARGRNVAIHCRQSIGRSALVAAAALAWRDI